MLKQWRAGQGKPAKKRESTFHAIGSCTAAKKQPEPLEGPGNGSKEFWTGNRPKLRGHLAIAWFSESSAAFLVSLWLSNSCPPSCDGSGGGNTSGTFSN